MAKSMQNLTSHHVNIWKTRIIAIGFLGSLGFTFIILGCVLSQTWWALLIFLFYAMTPFPLLFVRATDYQNLGDSDTNKAMDLAVFFISGIVVSTIAFPILLSHVPVDNPRIPFSSAFFTEFATLIFYITGGLFFITTSDEED